jgi:hypothetical protein
MCHTKSITYGSSSRIFLVVDVRPGTMHISGLVKIGRHQGMQRHILVVGHDIRRLSHRIVHYLFIAVPDLQCFCTRGSSIYLEIR